MRGLFARRRAAASAAPRRTETPPALVIFMGHHKVGSSSLQRFLATNWLRLARDGVLYPSVEAQGLARNLAESLQGAPLEAPGSVNIREPHNALAFKLIAEATGAAVPEWHPKLPSASQMFRAVDMLLAL